MQAEEQEERYRLGIDGQNVRLAKVDIDDGV